jgi:hypothetical protein
MHADPSVAMVGVEILGVVLGGVFVPYEARVIAGSDGEAAAVLALLARSELRGREAADFEVQ